VNHWAAEATIVAEGSFSPALYRRLLVAHFECRTTVVVNDDEQARVYFSLLRIALGDCQFSVSGKFKAGACVVNSTKIPKKVQDRFVAGLKRYQPIVRKLKERDVSEADTVTVVKDILCDIFGYDKYAELTSEQQIRGTFCDLAVKIEDKIHYLAEVKSAGTTLNDNHLRQAVNYGAHHGIEWVLLTNAITWKIYRIRFGQPIDWDEVCSFDLDSLSSRSSDDLGKLFMLSRESVTTDVLQAYHRQAQILNRYVVSELLQSEPMLQALRKEFRRLFDMKVAPEERALLLTANVLKRDTLEGDAPKAAKASVKKANSALARKATKASNASPVAIAAE